VDPVHADLPLKTYQIVNTFRYETKQTRAFIRVREIHFFESHTCHADFEDAERQVQEDYDIPAGSRRDGACPTSSSKERTGTSSGSVLYCRDRHAPAVRKKPAAGVDTPIQGELLAAL